MLTAIGLIKPAHIPESLWDHSTEVLQLPASLANAYETQINKHGLRELATTRADNEGPVGGMTKENADQHFAQMFDGSAARAILAVVDPKDEMGSTSDSFIKSTAGASLALTDAPCSAGAAALAFLTTLAERLQRASSNAS